LDQESDRGCVLVGAAWIEDGLEKLLRAKFKHDSGATDGDIDKLVSVEKTPNPPLEAAKKPVK
jgi:hypothetical protein